MPAADTFTVTYSHKSMNALLTFTVMSGIGQADANAQGDVIFQSLGLNLGDWTRTS